MINWIAVQTARRVLLAAQKAGFPVTTLIAIMDLWLASLADTGAMVLVTLNALGLLGHRVDRLWRTRTEARMKGASIVSRRSASIGFALVVTGLAYAPAHASAEMVVEMYRTSGCSCCLVWGRRLEADGFKVVVREAAMGQLMRMKLDAGLTPEQASCHTATIGGYVIEGHVPPREIRRLLSDRPAAAGLTVPGMPIGSPGMESGSSQDAYEVLLFRKGGATEVFASYPAKQ